MIRKSIKRNAFIALLVFLYIATSLTLFLCGIRFERQIPGFLWYVFLFLALLFSFFERKMRIKKWAIGVFILALLCQLFVLICSPLYDFLTRILQ